MKMINGYILDAPIEYDNMRVRMQNNNEIKAREDCSEYLKQLDSIPPWWMELREEATPHGYKFWRKTKAGLWELVTTITGLQNKKLVHEWFKAMWIKEQVNYPYFAAMKVTTLNDRQIYSTYYDKFYRYLSFLITNKETFGISINEGEEYLIHHNIFPEDSLKPIADYFCKLARQHKGIKSFAKAKYDEEDDYLYWGWLTFNDGYKISVAIDSYFKVYKQYQDNLQPVTISYLTKRK